MAHYRTSRILPTILTIIIIIVAIAGFVALARLIFGGGSSSTDKQQQVDTSRQNLLDTSADRSVVMTVRGPIVADEDFRSYQISISPSNRQFVSYKGYLDSVIDQQSLPNNTAAYDQFVHALDKANLTAGTPFEGEKNNVLGICATGKVYEFSVKTGADATETLWTSTCNGSPGSLKASVAQVSQLFLNQIPSGSNIEQSLNL